MTALLTLDEAARFIPGADASSLKRMARAGKLTVYRPGKKFLTTAAHVQEAIEACRVTPKVRDCGSGPSAETPREPSPTEQPGLSGTELASASLDSALAQAKSKKKTR